MANFRFQYICRRFEMVLGDARRVICSPSENPELFSAIPFSYGTLGFLVSVDIDIIPYKPFIK
jgi:delta24-sterol reductase